MIKCGQKRLRKELENYHNININVPNICYEQKNNTILFQEFILKIPNNYPFESPYHLGKPVFNTTQPKNIKALLFCKELVNILPYCFDTEYYKNCSFIHKNYNLTIPLTSFIIESILLQKYNILTNKLHSRYVNNFLNVLPDDILWYMLYYV
tara:strand:+ start:765 stop:1220 length:456 start_codon:yes stop_codon:yes gene_type:complete